MKNKKQYIGKIHLPGVPCGVDWKSARQLPTAEIPKGDNAPKITCKTCIRIWNESEK